VRASHRGSSGCTAIAVSPSMVSGRVVATTTSPWPSSKGYLDRDSMVREAGFVLQDSVTHIGFLHFTYGLVIQIYGIRGKIIPVQV